MLRNKFLQIIGISLCVVGLIGLIPSQYAWLQYKHALAGTPTVIVPAVADLPKPGPTVVSGHPIKIIIPSIGIDIGVQDGSYNEKTGAWSLSEKSAYYALPSTLPNNESGNTLIYGHANKYVFKNLPNLNEGAEAIIDTSEGYRFVYTYTSSESVSPTNTSIFTYEGPARLTVQTCTGSFMQNRQMHYFEFTRYEKL